MTFDEWQRSCDPSAMIAWLCKQGYDEAVWLFTIRCCRRIWDELPSGPFRRAVEYAEQIGTHGIDEILGDVHLALDKLGRRLRMADPAEQNRLNRRIGYGRMVLALDHQNGAGAADAISNDLLQWADDADAERRTQADLLRQLVVDPSYRDADTNEAPIL